MNARIAEPTPRAGAVEATVAAADAAPRGDAPGAAGGPAALPPEVYLIGCGEPGAVRGEPSAATMGGKAWNLLRMAELGLPVPAAFVLGTRHAQGREQGQQQEQTQRREPGQERGRPVAPGPVRADPALWRGALAALEAASGLALGDPRRPLLLSVRSGAPVSMPGMLETLLDIGLCEATLPGLLRSSGRPRLVWDAYRRLVASYAEVVHGVPAARFEACAEALFGERDERDLDFAELRTLARAGLAVFEREVGRPFPQDPAEQLASAIGAVFASWHAPKAREYRRLQGLPDAMGTAVTVQRMVFGNAGGLSGAGVGFTRDPASGEPAPWVDFLFDAQGEDVVSGRRSAHGHAALARVLPAAWRELQDAARTLERAFGDMQDFEFTVQDGRLWLLQARSGKRTPEAAVRIALDLHAEGVLTREQALDRTAGLDRAALARPCVQPRSGVDLAALGRAASASTGVAVGEIALDEARARARHAAGAAVVLVRRDAETADIGALECAVGLLTQRGARTSHAAVVARQLGRVCLVGCEGLRIDEAARSVQAAGLTLREGDAITLDGNEGVAYAGAAEVVLRHPEELLARLEALRGAAPGLRVNGA